MRFLLGVLEKIVLHLVFSLCLLFLNTKEWIKDEKKHFRMKSLLILNSYFEKEQKAICYFINPKMLDDNFKFQERFFNVFFFFTPVFFNSFMLSLLCQGLF